MHNERPKILIIDDDAVARAAVEGLLASEPYETYFASNGFDGISMAVNLHPDVVLLDVMMPKMNGFEVCRSIRSMPEIAEAPIILITSLDDHESRIQGLRAGADDFVTKPYNSMELFARLQTILRLNRYRRIAEQKEELQTLNKQLLVAYNKTIEGWSQALDLRDRETEGHTQRVMNLTIRFAKAVGFSEADLEHVRRGSLLHDVGKLGIPDAILHKAAKLTDEEWFIMRKHPVYAYQWLSSIDFLEPALDIPYCHHEKWDGSGYPRGIKGEAIPISARLFAIVDVWDALCSDRPYRSAMSKADALDYIRSESGTHFDPELVKIFTELVKDEIEGNSQVS
ncbi:MAG TPA: response regulator [Anaerolineales bacterium]|nr:response regulator [Anaerolineales bacterium]HMV97288.1 response regulator [Anaerolineales bacterium]HMX20347.1 response regulator [Anaerolineales bacterium]HMX75314.1 response regulator [Anaerolineales bacterium]HNF35162.1 response regulator [Anaerolineales bacterium]